jgi:hypothetical protein
MYMDAGRMRGNYSAHAILRSARPDDREAFRRRFGLDDLYSSGNAQIGPGKCGIDWR